MNTSKIKANYKKYRFFTIKEWQNMRIPTRPTNNRVMIAETDKAKYFRQEIEQSCKSGWEEFYTFENELCVELADESLYAFSHDALNARRFFDLVSK